VIAPKHHDRANDRYVEQECPDNARHLDGERDKRPYWNALTSRPRNHCPSRVLLRLKVGKAARAPCISIFDKYLLPRLVMPNRRGLTSCRRLPRDKPKPRGEVATPRESLCIQTARQAQLR
jgi:hypothetical protein